MFDYIANILLLMAADGTGVKPLLDLWNSFSELRDGWFEVLLNFLVLCSMHMLAAPFSKELTTEFTLVAPALSQVIIEVIYVPR